MEVRQAGNRPLHLLSLFNEKGKRKIFLKNNYKYYRNYKSEICQTVKNFTTQLYLYLHLLLKKELINQYLSAFKKVCNYLNEKSI